MPSRHRPSVIVALLLKGNAVQLKRERAGQDWVAAAAADAADTKLSMFFTQISQPLKSFFFRRLMCCVGPWLKAGEGGDRMISCENN